MEEIFPFLVGLAIMAYKIYDNFKKEQDKARKRNPASGESNEEKPVSVPKQVRGEVKPKPVPMENPEPVFRYEPEYKTVYHEPLPQRPPREERLEPIKRETMARPSSRNPERPAIEVLHSRAVHQPHQHKVELHQEDKERHPYADFDFKDAIVKEAILNRPEY